MLAFLLFACSDPPTVEVTVVDAWDKPIEGAQVRQETVTESFVTDGDGVTRLPAEVGTLHLMAGKDGYIKDFAVVTILEGQEEGQSVRLALYPEPETTGFYAVGGKAYEPLEEAAISVVESEMSTYHGIKNLPKTTFHSGGDPARFVFKTTLTNNEIKRQDLKLSKLEYLDEAEVTGLLGPETVKLSLYVADTDAEFSFKGLQSQDEYLIVTQDTLEPGVYAFHAQGILHTTENDALEKLPESMQVAFPFEVKGGGK